MSRPHCAALRAVLEKDTIKELGKYSRDFVYTGKVRGVVVGNGLVIFYIGMCVKYCCKRLYIFVNYAHGGKILIVSLQKNGRNPYKTFQYSKRKDFHVCTLLDKTLKRSVVKCAQCCIVD